MFIEFTSEAFDRLVLMDGDHTSNNTRAVRIGKKVSLIAIATPSQCIELIGEGTFDTSRRIDREAIIYFYASVILRTPKFSRIAHFAFDTSGSI